jgi:hypothetical protein
MSKGSISKKKIRRLKKYKENEKEEEEDLKINIS